MVEYTQQVMPGTVEVVRPVAPGEGVVRADEDAAPGAELVPAGRPLRAQDLAMLAAAGVTTVTAYARPRVTIFSTGDEVVPPETATLRPGPGQGRDRGRAGRHGGRGGRRARAVRHRPRRPAGAGGGAACRTASQRPGRDLGGILGRGAGRDGGRGRSPRHDLVPRHRGQAGQAHAAGRVRRRPGHRAARQPPVRAGGVPAARRPPGAPRRRLHRTAAPSRRSAPGWPATCRPRRAAWTWSRFAWPTAWPRPCSGCPRCCR